MKQPKYKAGDKVYIIDSNDESKKEIILPEDTRIELLGMGDHSEFIYLINGDTSGFLECELSDK